MANDGELNTLLYSNELINSTNEGSFEKVKSCVDQGCEVNPTRVDGRTPLMIACGNERLDIVYYLLSRCKEVDVNAQEQSGRTALMLTSSKDIAELLILREANINEKDIYGNTPLMFACNSGSTELSQFLIQKGADVEQSNSDGFTPLMFASSQGHVEVVSILIENGSSVNHKNNDGLTPLICSNLLGHKDVATLLIKKGAQDNEENKVDFTSMRGAPFNGKEDFAALTTNLGTNSTDQNKFAFLEVNSQNFREKICKNQLQADPKKTYYGSYESQLQVDRETLLSSQECDCMTNQEHKQFIPLDKFTITDLPDGFREQVIYDYVKATAAITVRVDVRMTSLKRDTFIIDGKDIRGSECLRTGTGMLAKINMFTNSVVYKCKCNTCQYSKEPSDIWGIIIIRTASHIVFDELEAANTSCKFFYDKEDSNVTTLHGWKYFLEEFDDTQYLHCITCNTEFLDKLMSFLDNYDMLGDELNNKYMISNNLPEFNFIVSHPHGYPKQVSLGQKICRKLKQSNDDAKRKIRKFWYTTSTCQGSSGAGFNLLVSNSHIHKGVGDDGINFSDFGYEFKKLDVSFPLSI